MRLQGPLPPALGVPGVLGTRQMQERNAKLDRATTPPGRPKHNSAALLSQQQHCVFQQDALADPSWQPQDLWWHAGLALG